MRNLFALRLAIWDMATYIDFRDYDKCSNPRSCEHLLFNSEDEAKEYAAKLYSDDSTYNDATLHRMQMDDKDILDISGFESIEDFEEAMREGYPADITTTWRNKPFGLDERERLAEYIIDNGEDLDAVDCANYDIDKSIEGSIVVVWQWHRYVGYARKFVELRYAYDGETEANLTEDDTVSGDKIDIVMTKEEVENCEDLESALTDKLIADWKWTNVRDVERAIDEF